MKAFEFTKGEAVRVRGQAGEDDGEVIAVLDPDHLPSVKNRQVPIDLVQQTLEKLGVDYCLMIAHRMDTTRVDLFMAFHLVNGQWRDLSGQRIFVFHHYGRQGRIAEG